MQCAVRSADSSAFGFDRWRARVRQRRKRKSNSEIDSNVWSVCCSHAKLAFCPVYPLSTNDKSHICCAHSRKSPIKDQLKAVRERACAIDNGCLIAAFGQSSVQCNAEIVLDFVQPVLPNNAARQNTHFSRTENNLSIARQIPI